jgi:dihydroneopterin aldolase
MRSILLVHSGKLYRQAAGKTAGPTAKPRGPDATTPGDRTTMAGEPTLIDAMSIRRIFFSQLALDARIGILEHELRATQPLHVDAEFDVDVRQKTQDQDIQTVLDYRLLRSAIVDECTRTHVNLLETLIDRVADRLLREFPDVLRLKLRISKPSAFSDCAAVGIEIERARAA